MYTKLSSCRHNDNDNVSNGQIHTPRCLPVDTTTGHNVINGQIIIHSTLFSVDTTTGHNVINGQIIIHTTLFSCRHNHKS